MIYKSSGLGTMYKDGWCFVYLSIKFSNKHFEFYIDIPTHMQHNITLGM